MVVKNKTRIRKQKHFIQQEIPCYKTRRKRLHSLGGFHAYPPVSIFWPQANTRIKNFCTVYNSSFGAATILKSYAVRDWGPTKPGKFRKNHNKPAVKFTQKMVYQLIEKMKVFLRLRGLRVSGNKSELVARVFVVK